MKTMLKFIKKVAESLGLALEKEAESGDDFELKETFGKFSLDSLASCAFGVDAESFTNKDSLFAKYASRMFVNSGKENAIAALRFIPGVSQIINLLKLNTFKPKETRFFRDTVVHVLKQRRQTGERKNDLIDLMIDCMKEEEETSENVTKGETDLLVEGETGRGKVDSKGPAEETGRVKVDEDLVVATAMVMLIAGYDTTGMTLAYLMYELAQHPDVQQRLQEEVDQAYEQHGGEMPDYTVIQGLPYLEMVILETLRMHTPLGMIVRACTKDYR